MLTKDDIHCAFPDDQALLVSQCGYAAVLEQVCALIYTGRRRPLREVYSTAKDLHVHIGQWAKQSGLLPDSGNSKELMSDNVSKLTLYSGKQYTPCFRVAGLLRQIRLLLPDPPCIQALFDCVFGTEVGFARSANGGALDSTGLQACHRCRAGLYRFGKQLISQLRCVQGLTRPRHN